MPRPIPALLRMPSNQYIGPGICTHIIPFRSALISAVFLSLRTMQQYNYVNFQIPSTVAAEEAGS